MQAGFHDEDDAAAVVTLLVGKGFEAASRRGRFAGEDDDEDQPWVVETDAPLVVLEPLAEQHEGWVERDASFPRAPLDLPAAPRRAHRPARGRAHRDVGGGT
jgi:hypothetical protein